LSSGVGSVTIVVRVGVESELSAAVTVISGEGWI